MVKTMTKPNNLNRKLLMMVFFPNQVHNHRHNMRGESSRTSKAKSPLQFGNYNIPRKHPYTPTLTHHNPYLPTHPSYSDVLHCPNATQHAIDQFHHDYNDFNKVHRKFRFDVYEFDRKLDPNSFIGLPIWMIFEL